MKTKHTILINDLRETLKQVVQKEIENLPEQLKTLTPKERIEAICKLMPYVFPKVETVNSKQGEPLQFESY